MRGTRVMIAALAVTAVAVAGCGDDEDSSTTTTEPAAASTAPDSTEPADVGETGTGEEEAAAAATVAVADSELGETLVDGEGRTLYLFTQDTDGTSTCSGDCLTTWPPLETTGEPMAGPGVDESLLGTVDGEGGSTIVTYASQPLYYYAGDSGPGDVTGQGVGEVWYVVAPTGEAITDAPG